MTYISGRREYTAEKVGIQGDRRVKESRNYPLYRRKSRHPGRLMAGRGVLNEGNGIKENCKTWAHYRKRLICRVPNSLPCAKRRAHSKQPLCRVPKIKHTANPRHTAKLPLCRVPASGTHGKNQTHGILLSLPCAVLKTHGKPRARATHVRRWRTEVDGG